jgi:3-deoxy-7-phosphoheptulonate synthase
MLTDNLRIVRTHPLISPAVLEEELPLTESAAALVRASRQSIRQILWGDDARLLVIVGPCSVHDPAAAQEYAVRLAELARQIEHRVFCVMRVYFEKPRTVVGWKGLINDPGLDGTYQINRGLRLARQLLIDVAAAGLPAGTEFLDTTFGQYYTDLISWGAIGARTVESQIHRELASGLSMPVGIKNRTDGNVQVAIDAIRAAGHRHLFPSLTKEGAPAIFETGGNPDCHLVLRGGDRPNYDAAAVGAAQALLREAGLPDVVMVDCSHANSGKDPARQPEVASAVCAQRLAGNRGVRALMLESHLVGGRQDIGPALRYGQSITDGCLGFAETRALLLALCEALDR